MLRNTLAIIFALLFGISAYSQDCENYFLYQQNDSLTFTFQGFMVDPGQTLYNWDFGDGNTGSGKVVTHIFDPQGSNTFEVCLYTETHDGMGNICYDTSCQDITVGTAPGCVAFFFGTESPSNPMTWTFHDFSSGNPTSWEWDFGDGNTSNVQNPLHTFAVDGTYQVCLHIYDTVANCDDEYCKEIVVVGIPVYECESDFTYSSNDLITFDFTGYMLDSTQQGAEYYWTFGDGNTGTGQNPTHTYQLAGASFVTVCMTTTMVFNGTDTCNFTTCREVYVGNPVNCQALYEWTFSSDPLTIDFTDISTGGPTSWDWNFGDSTHSNQQHPSHTFYRDGWFTICLTITNDSNQCTSTFCTDIFVNNLPPPVDCNNTISFTNGSDIYSYNFHGEAFSNGNNVSQNSTFTWNLGDGNTASGQDVTHTYASTGSYAVTLTTVSLVNASDTCVAYSYDSIHISNVTYCIGGNVLIDSLTTADGGFVHLMSYDATNGTIVNEETTIFDSNGNYLFNEVSMSNGLDLYVQAELSQQSAHFGQYVPSYYYDAVNWTEALLATTEECPPIFMHNIMLQQSTAAAVGNGSISGVVYSSDTKSIIFDLEILLLDENMLPLKYVYTDNNGLFNFTDLALGSYYIYPEMVGIETDGFMVTLTEEEESAELILIVGDGTASLSVEEYSFINVLGGIYPNPARTNINIKLTAEKNVNVVFSVYNQLGQEMIIQSKKLTKGVNNIELDISDLPESVYYLRMQATEGKPSMRTFIKGK